MKTIKIGLVGFGTIGSGVVEILYYQRDSIHAKHNIDLQLKYICDIDLDTDRGVPIEGPKLVDDYNIILEDKEVDIVIELIGGTTIAKDLVLAALSAGKQVVTANKALLAYHGKEIFTLAQEKGKIVGFEASVGGGIPIIRTIMDYLVCDSISEINGIVNGTCNYILTQMQDNELDFDKALQMAQEFGFAEADPTLDITGGDSFHKIVILSNIAFNGYFDINLVDYKGIDNIKPIDLQLTNSLGYNVKLVANARYEPDKTISTAVFPALVPYDNPLSWVKNEFNAIMIHSQFLSESMLMGKGAGSGPTAVAVIADLINLVVYSEQNQLAANYPAPTPLHINPLSQQDFRFYIRWNLNYQPEEEDIHEIFEKSHCKLLDILMEEQDGTYNVIVITEPSKIKNVEIASSFIEENNHINDQTILRIL